MADEKNLNLPEMEPVAETDPAKLAAEVEAARQEAEAQEEMYTAEAEPGSPAGTETDPVRPTKPGMQAAVAEPPLGTSTQPGESGPAPSTDVGEYVAMDGGTGGKAVKPPAEPEKKKAAGGLWQNWLWPITTLVVICVVTSLLLGLTNELTAPIIAANVSAADDAARAELLPSADSFETVEVPEGMDNVTSIYKAANGSGWVIGAYGRGYGGEVPVLVAFDAEGTIVGVTFTENSETVGLGQKVREPEFQDQFAGLSAENISLGDIDKIASATISSGAAVNAINAAIDAYIVSTGGTVTTTQSPEEVRATLLPGETLSPIAISAENVQPTAYYSSGGNYILYGEYTSEGEYGSTVVAAVAMDAEGTILDLWIDTSGESEQYGQTLASNTAFLDSFKGKSAPVQVDVVADITNSSNSVMQAVNTALDALPLAKAFYEDLLPGESLTPIAVDAENVQPVAYRSDAGNYILFGEKPSEGEYGGTTVAAVAVDENGVILNLWIDTSGDSPEYGQTLATNSDFLNSFVGQSAPAQVDAVADITNSSTSVMEAVNTALGALPQAKEAA